tara:strand:- start:5126 stop:5764 length:639 start_codon:yes stop_codon:yes gene_type:complete
MKLNCNNICEHNLCKGLCATCQLEPLKFLGRDIQQVINSKLPKMTYLKGYKIPVEKYEGDFYLSKDKNNVKGIPECLYEFYIQSTEEALIGFYYGIWDYSSDMFKIEISDMLRTRAYYELNFNSDEHFTLAKSFGKYAIETFNPDAYSTTYHVNYPREFAAGFYLAINFPVIDSDFNIHIHQDSNVWIGDNLVKPDFNSIELCIHRNIIFEK